MFSCLPEFYFLFSWLPCAEKAESFVNKAIAGFALVSISSIKKRSFCNGLVTYFKVEGTQDENVTEILTFNCIH